MYVNFDGDDNLTGEQRLIGAILARAYQDLGSKRAHIRKSAIEFWSGRWGGLEWWSEAAGIPVKTLQRFAGIRQE